MISFISGVIVTVAGVTGVWYCKPRGGEVQWFVVAPILDWLIPTGLIAALGLGIALIVSGAVG
jgi:hypothetical protein